MRGIPGQEQLAVAHRLGDEAAHGGHALLDDRAFMHLAGPAGAGQAGVQRIPDARIRPLRQVLVGRALHVHPAQRLAAHGGEREAVGVAGVDQLVAGRLRLGQDAEPGEGVEPVVDGHRGGRDRRAADAVEAVTAGDEVAVQRAAGPADAGPPADVVHRDPAGVEDQRLPVGQALRDQVAHHLLLAVDGDALAGEPGQVDAVVLALKTQLHAVMRQALAVQAGGHAGIGERVHAALLEQPGADAAFDIGAVAGFDHDAVDAGAGQQMRQQQPRRPGADNADLSAHRLFPIV